MRFPSLIVSKAREGEGRKGRIRKGERGWQDRGMEESIRKRKSERK